MADILNKSEREDYPFSIFLPHIELETQMINLLKIMEIIIFCIVFTENENSHTNCHTMQHLTKTHENRVVISFSLEKNKLVVLTYHAY